MSRVWKREALIGGFLSEGALAIEAPVVSCLGVPVVGLSEEVGASG